MDAEIKTKQVKIVFVYSDILGQRNYRIQFDNGDKYVVDRAFCKDTPYDFELVNNEKTIVKLKGIYESPHGLVAPEQNTPFQFTEIRFPFKAGETYYLEIISENEIRITPENPKETND